MTIKDIFTAVTLLVAGTGLGGFAVALVTQLAFPNTSLARDSAVLFRLATWEIVAYVPFAIGLMSVWAVRQAWSSTEILFADGYRRLLQHRGPGHSDEYTPIDLDALPLPRHATLKWMEDEIEDILGKGAAPDGHTEA